MYVCEVDPGYVIRFHKKQQQQHHSAALYTLYLEGASLAAVSRE